MKKEKENLRYSIFQNIVFLNCARGAGVGFTPSAALAVLTGNGPESFAKSSDFLIDFRIRIW